MSMKSRVLAFAIVFFSFLCYFTARNQASEIAYQTNLSIIYKSKSMHKMNLFKETMTTIFWVGEDASSENGYIHNHGSYWDSNWMKHFGGVDNPLNRRGYMPATFTPKQNPFYVALPFAEVDPEGHLKEVAKKIPGYGTGRGPLTRNRWVEIRYRGTSCFAQWQDVGPFGEDDFDWVFGAADKPKNTKGLKAGLDISPAAAQYLNMKDSDRSEWRFVDEKDVPDGPWKAIVTQ
jgi:hypothetical protein